MRQKSTDTSGQKFIKIDFILTSRGINRTQLLDWRGLTPPNLGTGHQLISFNISLYKEKYNLESLSSDSTKKSYEHRLTGKFKQCIRQADEEVLKMRTININTKQSKKLKQYGSHDIYGAQKNV